MSAAMSLRLGDRIVIEPLDAEPFEAKVLVHHGWGIVHGELVIGCEKDDGEKFSYGIRYDADVTVVSEATP